MSQENKPTATASDSLATEVRRVIDQLDDRGAWVEKGRLLEYGDDDPTMHIITTSTFVAQVETLCEFIESRQ